MTLGHTLDPPSAPTQNNVCPGDNSFEFPVKF